MRKSFLILYWLLCSFLASAQTGSGGGDDYYYDDEHIVFTFDSALRFFIIGIVFIIIGFILYYLYKSKWDGKKYIKAISTILIAIGILYLYPFLHYVWLYVVGGIIVLLALGYVVYYIYVNKKGGDQKMKSTPYYLDVVSDGIYMIIDKIKGKD